MNTTHDTAPETKQKAAPTPALVERNLYPIPEALHRLGGASQATFYRWLKGGKIRTVKVGKRRFVPADEIARIANEGIGTSMQRDDWKFGPKAA